MTEAARPFLERIHLEHPETTKDFLIQQLLLLELEERGLLQGESEAPRGLLVLLHGDTTWVFLSHAEQLDDKLVIAISSRALFNLDDSHQVYESDGLAAYSEYQVAREEEPLEPGEAFPLVHKLLRLNDSWARSPR